MYLRNDSFLHFIVVCPTCEQSKTFSRSNTTSPSSALIRRGLQTCTNTGLKHPCYYICAKDTEKIQLLVCISESEHAWKRTSTNDYRKGLQKSGITRHVVMNIMCMSLSSLGHSIYNFMHHDIPILSLRSKFNLLLNYPLSTPT